MAVRRDEWKLTPPLSPFSNCSDSVSKQARRGNPAVAICALGLNRVVARPRTAETIRHWSDFASPK
jgi:hypothetical protein